MTLAALGFDVPRFRDWLSEVTGEPAEVAVSPIRGGGSCEMFRVERLGQSWVVRRAPLAAVSDTANPDTSVFVCSPAAAEASAPATVIV